MSTKLRILGVHGLGDHRQSDWKERWQETITEVFPKNGAVEPEFHFLTYDDIFAGVEISPAEATAAALKLLRSGAGSLFRPRPKGLFDLPETLKWTAGYVVAWLEDHGFQKATRDRILSTLATVKPHVLLGHSLGSLVTYNSLTHPDGNTPQLASLLGQLTYVTLGSQIGNPMVVGNLTAGRIVPLPVRRWVHLFNRHDHVFTEPIQLWDADNYFQVDTPFDIPGWANHEGTHYLGHPATAARLWQPLAMEPGPRRLPGKGKAATVAAPGIVAATRFTGKTTPRPVRRRALLVGINDYPDPADRLGGCVNDAFLVSAALQEFGFAPEGIRLCLDERATAAGIRERLQWLLDDPRPGDQLFFFYSGHGAQLPTYGEGDVVDRRDESLVPHDFNWTAETSITDDQIFALYSQLPYDTRLVMAFDCCHSGGIHRAGLPRAKGLTPPDDIRHRGLAWNKELQMWQERKLPHINDRFSRKKEKQALFFGSGGASARLGRASTLRRLDEEHYQHAKLAQPEQPIGPYLPMIFEACQEDQYAYEYRHGAISYGAFTFALVTNLRQGKGKAQSFAQLVGNTAKTLSKLGYDQQPSLLGPTALVNTKIPW